MKKTVTLDSQIKKYTAMACGVAAATGASAQVMYTDISPDATITGHQSQYTVDFDGDGNFDVAFAMFQGSQPGSFSSISYNIYYAAGVATFGTGAPGTNGWMGSSSEVSGLSSGVRIGSSKSFFQSQGGMGTVQSTYLGSPYSNTYGPYNSGAFQGTEAYLGVRFDINGATHYGWVRVEMDAAATTMTIKDYAYESSADTPINAGSQASMASIDEIAGQVSVINFHNTINITLDGINEADVTVVGLDGKQHANQTIGSTASLDLTNLATGIYLVNVNSAEGTTTKKIYIK